MNTLTELFSTAAAQRIGWALVHFLWQGAAVAMLLAVGLALLRRRSAQARWLACCVALGLMAVLPVATGLMVYVEPPAGPVAPAVAADWVHPSAGQPVTASDMASAPSPTGTLPPAGAAGLRRDHGQPQTAGQATSPAAPGKPTAAAAWPQRLQGAIQPALPWAILAWLAGVSVMSVWHVGGWLAVGRMRRLGTRPVEPAIQETFARLLQRLRVRRPVRLLESLRAAVPVVAGWLRPVILLPVGAATGLTVQQLEAILAHELAHVRRWDCLVQALAAVMETLLFYHPAVWWVSRRIRQESEQCCDDLAVAAISSTGILPVGRTGVSPVQGQVVPAAHVRDAHAAPDPRRVYAVALARVAELGAAASRGRSRDAAFAAGAANARGATGGKLLPRIRRLLGPERPSPLSFGRCLSGVLALVTIVAIAIAVGLSCSSQPGPRMDLADRPATQPAGEWGKAFNGLQSRIVFARTAFKQGEAIEPRVEVRNVGDRAVAYNLNMAGLDAMSGTSRFKVIGPGGQPVPDIGETSQVDVADAAGPQAVLKPGETVAVPCNRLDTHHYMRRPGRYRITWTGLSPLPTGAELTEMMRRVVYEEPLAAPEASPAARTEGEHLLPSSDTVEIEVAPAPGGGPDGDLVGRILGVLPPGWRVHGATLLAEKVGPPGYAPGPGSRIGLVHRPVADSLMNNYFGAVWVTKEALAPAGDRSMVLYLGKGDLGHVYVAPGEKNEGRWTYISGDVAFALGVRNPALPTAAELRHVDWGRLVCGILDGCATAKPRQEALVDLCQRARIERETPTEELAGIHYQSNASVYATVGRKDLGRPYYYVSFSVRPIPDPGGTKDIAAIKLPIAWDGRAEVRNYRDQQHGVDFLVGVWSDDDAFRKTVNAVIDREVNLALSPTPPGPRPVKRDLKILSWIEFVDKDDLPAGLYCGVPLYATTDHPGAKAVYQLARGYAELLRGGEPTGPYVIKGVRAGLMPELVGRLAGAYTAKGTLEVAEEVLKGDTITIRLRYIAEDRDIASSPGAMVRVSGDKQFKSVYLFGVMPKDLPPGKYTVNVELDEYLRQGDKVVFAPKTAIRMSERLTATYIVPEPAAPAATQPAATKVVRIEVKFDGASAQTVADAIGLVLGPRLFRLNVVDSVTAVSSTGRCELYAGVSDDDPVEALRQIDAVWEAAKGDLPIGVDKTDTRLLPLGAKIPQPVVRSIPITKVEIDRDRAGALGVSVKDVEKAIAPYVGPGAPPQAKPLAQVKVLAGDKWIALTQVARLVPGTTPSHVVTTWGAGEKSLAAPPVTQPAGLGESLAWVWGDLRILLGPDGTEVPPRAALKGLITPVRNAAAVAAGSTTAYVLDGDGAVWAWGHGPERIGAGSKGDALDPVCVSGLTDVAAISAGFSHALALKRDGTVWAWGRNNRGQLGDGSTDARNRPVQARGLRDIVAIAAGRDHSLALAKDGAVWAWGDNYAHQTDPSSDFDHCAAPVKVAGLPEVRAIADGYTHCLVLAKDGAVWQWPSATGARFARLEGVAKVKAIASGAWFSLALREDGTLWTWGDFRQGWRSIDPATVIGTENAKAYREAVASRPATSGPFKDEIIPYRVQDWNDVAAISAECRAVVLRRDGAVWEWGWDCPLRKAETPASVRAIATGWNVSMALVPVAQPATQPAGASAQTDWGKETAGLKSRVSLPKSKFSVGEPVVARLEVTNVSGQPIRIPKEIGFFYSNTNHSYEGQTPTGLIGQESARPAGDADTILLRPGDKHVFPHYAAALDLTRQSAKAGRYTFSYSLARYPKEKGTWSGLLVSNTVAYEVVPAAPPATQPAGLDLDAAAKELGLKLPVQVTEASSYDDGGTMFLRLVGAGDQKLDVFLDGRMNSVPPRRLFTKAYPGKEGSQEQPIGGPTEQAVRTLLQAWLDREVDPDKQARLRALRGAQVPPPADMKIVHVIGLVQILSARAGAATHPTDDADWSKPVNGLRMRVSLEGGRFDPDKPSVFVFEFENVSDKPLRILKDPKRRRDINRTLLDASGVFIPEPIIADVQMIEIAVLPEDTVLLAPGATRRVTYSEQLRDPKIAKVRFSYRPVGNTNSELKDYWHATLKDSVPRAECSLLPAAPPTTQPVLGLKLPVQVTEVRYIEDGGTTHMRLAGADGAKLDVFMDGRIADPPRPRHLFTGAHPEKPGSQQVPIGSQTERAVLALLQAWMDRQADPEKQARLAAMTGVGDLGPEDVKLLRVLRVIGTLTAHARPAGWTEPVNGLRWRAWLGGDKAEAGGTIEVNVEFQNVSDKPLRLLKDVTTKRNIGRTFFTADGQRSVLSIEHPDKLPVREEETVLLAPDGSHRVRQQWPAPQVPGAARVWFHYDSPVNTNAQVKDFWAGMLRGLTLEFTVVEPAPPTTQRAGPDLDAAAKVLGLKLPVQVTEASSYDDGGTMLLRLVDAGDQKLDVFLDGRMSSRPPRRLFTGAYPGKEGSQEQPIGGQTEQAVRTLLQAWLDRDVDPEKQARLRALRGAQLPPPEDMKIVHAIGLIQMLSARAGTTTQPAGLDLDAAAKLLTEKVGGTWEKKPNWPMLMGSVPVAGGNETRAFAVFPVPLDGAGRKLIGQYAMAVSVVIHLLGSNDRCTVLAWFTADTPEAKAVVKALDLRPATVTADELRRTEGEAIRRVARLAASLRANKPGFVLSVEYRAPQADFNSPERGDHRLTFTVAPPPRGPTVVGEYTQITEAQAERIVDYLAAEQVFLGRASDVMGKGVGGGPRPGCTWLVWGASEPSEPDPDKLHPMLLRQSTAAEPEMLARLDGLRKVLDGDAAKAMDGLLKRLQPHRKEWEKASATATQPTGDTGESPASGMVGITKALDLTPEQQAKVKGWFDARKDQTALSPAEMVKFLRTILDDKQRAVLERMVESGTMPTTNPAGAAPEAPAPAPQPATRPAPRFTSEPFIVPLGGGKEIVIRPHARKLEEAGTWLSGEDMAAFVRRCRERLPKVINGDYGNAVIGELRERPAPGEPALPPMEVKLKDVADFEVRPAAPPATQPAKLDHQRMWERILAACAEVERDPPSLAAFRTGAKADTGNKEDAAWKYESNADIFYHNGEGLTFRAGPGMDESNLGTGYDRGMTASRRDRTRPYYFVRISVRLLVIDQGGLPAGEPKVLPNLKPPERMYVIKGIYAVKPAGAGDASPTLQSAGVGVTVLSDDADFTKTLNAILDREITRALKESAATAAPPETLRPDDQAAARAAIGRLIEYVRSLRPENHEAMIGLDSQRMGRENQDRLHELSSRVWAVRHFGRGAVPVLLEHIEKAAGKWERFWLLETLSDLRDARALDTFGRHARGEDRDLAGASLGGLELIGLPAVETLRKLATDPTGPLRFKVMQALHGIAKAKAESPESVGDILQTALALRGDKEADVRWMAAEIMALGDKSFTKPLAGILADENRTVRSRTVQILAERKDPAAIPYLMDALAAAGPKEVAKDLEAQHQIAIAVAALAGLELPPLQVRYRESTYGPQLPYYVGQEERIRFVTDWWAKEGRGKYPPAGPAPSITQPAGRA